MRLTPGSQALLDALVAGVQALSDATGQAWILTNVPLDAPSDPQAGSEPADQYQPCRFYGKAQ